MRPLYLLPLLATLLTACNALCDPGEGVCTTDRELAVCTRQADGGGRWRVVHCPGPRGCERLQTTTFLCDSQDGGWL